MIKKIDKFAQFKNWFFKGRIEKAIAKKRRIEILSREYDEGKIVNKNLIGENKK